jgi:hypothetical protein
LFGLFLSLKPPDTGAIYPGYKGFNFVPGGCNVSILGMEVK